VPELAPTWARRPRRANRARLVTDDVNGDHGRLSEAGVELTTAPTDMPYGRDCGLRDPSGNQLRLAQLAPQFAAA